MKAVFTHKPSSIYDDLPEERYHFPQAYLRQVEQTVGDFIIYYEPGRTGLTEQGRTGRRAYVATAQVLDVTPDVTRPDHFYAVIDSSTYVPFDRAVPFREGSHYFEGQLRREDGQTSKGAFGRAVRPLSESEYDRILRAGFAALLPPDPPAVLPSVPYSMIFDPPAGEFERPLVERVMSRPVRDAAFARAIQGAYDSTCAVTGLRLINGGGRAEVQAAHIRPVADRGPDSIRNGLALSGTVHWMFDRGLISIGPPPTFEILVTSRGLPEPVLGLLAPNRQLRLPKDPVLHPAPTYLDYHRTCVFKG